MSKAFTVSCVKIGSTVIHQIQDQEIDPNIETILMGGSGKVYNTFSADAQIAPVCRFTTTAIKTALDACGVSGLEVGDGSNVEIYFQQYKHAGMREGASKHIKLTVGRGLIMPDSLTADQQSSSITYSVFAVYDGVNDPMQKAINQSLPSVDEADEGWVAGPAEVNGSAVGTVQDLNISFGLAPETVQGDGVEYPDMVYINTIQPGMTVNTLNLDFVDTLGIEGVKQGATASEVYLRALDDGGKRIAVGETDHIKFIQEKGKIKNGGIRASHGGRATLTVVYEPTYDNSNAPITVNTACVIG